MTNRPLRPATRLLCSCLAAICLGGPSIIPVVKAQESISPPSDSAPTPVFSRRAKTRTPLSQAVERFLRARYTFPVADAEFAETAERIARAVEAAQVPDATIRDLMKSEPDGEHFYLPWVYSRATGETISRAERAQFDHLSKQIAQCIGPYLVWRMEVWALGKYASGTVFPEGSEERFKQWPRYSGDGMLWKEEVISAREMVRVAVTRANAGLPSREREAIRNRYMGLAGSLSDARVLTCTYIDSAETRTSGPFFYWYKQAPEGLTEELKARLPEDHPVLAVGAPRVLAPERSPKMP